MMEFLSLEDKKNVSLKILVELDRFCQENGICYFLAYGTLLGAVRHKGFIPWDDDVDVWLMRNDYEQLRIKWNEKRYRFSDCHTIKKYGLTYAKIQDTSTVAVKGGVMMEDGLGIDIFPLDYLPDDKKVAILEYEKFRNMADTMHRKLWAYSTEKDISGVRKWIGDISRKSGWNNFMARVVEHLAKRKFSTITNHCSCVVDMYPAAFDYICTDWLKTIPLKFEGYCFNAPVGYDKILTVLYGEYMKLPPEEKRITTHDVEFVWKNK